MDLSLTTDQNDRPYGPTLQMAEVQTECESTRQLVRQPQLEKRKTVWDETSRRTDQEKVQSTFYQRHRFCSWRVSPLLSRWDAHD